MSRKYLTVTALTRYMKKKLEIDPHLQDVWLTGEISNFYHHGSGHMYFTVKDDKTRIKAMMAQKDNRQLKFTPENGMHILAKGTISIYEQNGEYQIYIHTLEPDGVGSLYLAYEQLKTKLATAGIFGVEHKKEIPKFPTHIGVITSPTGAAIRDVITTIKRRYPIVQVTVIPVTVQGDQAAPSIVRAITLANELNVFDTLIVGRGGGSIEDLWSFNEESVVMAIHHSAIPIISAVGHETDTTLSDLVADLRAATPTGAAELAVPSLLDLKTRVNNLSQHIADKTHLAISNRKNQLQNIQSSRGFLIPRQLILQNAQYLDRLVSDLKKHLVNIQHNKKAEYQNLANRLALKSPENKIMHEQNKLKSIEYTLHNNFKHALNRKENNFQMLVDKLLILNPLETLKRGFSIPYGADGKIIKTIDAVSEDEEIKIQVLDGFINANVVETEEERLL